METNTIFLLRTKTGLIARIIQWLVTNLMVRSASVKNLAPEQTLVQFVTKERKSGISIFYDLNDNDLLELSKSVVVEMDAHVIEVDYEDNSTMLGTDFSTFVFLVNSANYDLYTKLAGIKALVTGKGQMSDDERPKLPWQ